MARPQYSLPLAKFVTTCHTGHLWLPWTLLSVPSYHGHYSLFPELAATMDTTPCLGGLVTATVVTDLFISDLEEQLTYSEYIVVQVKLMIDSMCM